MDMYHIKIVCMVAVERHFSIQLISTNNVFVAPTLSIHSIEICCYMFQQTNIKKQIHFTLHDITR